MLQPIAFQPIIVPKMWGTEVWTISAQGDRISIVANGPLKGNSINELVEVYMDELVGQHVFDRYNTIFPLLFKRIDAQDDLSIQVHPNDEHASGMGKSEMWYVSDALPGAAILMGFNKNLTEGDVRRAIAGNTLEELVNHQPVEVGDVAYIPAGRVHALCKGTQVMEIQQTSDTTYRLYDYGRIDKEGKPRDLHISEGLSVLNYKRLVQPLVDYELQANDLTPLVRDEHFVTNILYLTHKVSRDTYDLDSFVVYMLLEGACTINGVPMRAHPLGDNQPRHTDTLMIPASITDVDIVPYGEAKLLEIYVP